MPIPNKNNFIKRDSAKEKVYSSICDWIVYGELQPGEKLNVSELAEHFDVSRTPVREALLTLQAQKLVEVTPGKATVVTQIDRNDVEKSYRPLAEIQGLAVEIACNNIKEDDLDKLENNYHNLEKSISQNNINDSVKYDECFHKLLLDIADNEYIKEFSDMLMLHIKRIKYNYFKFDTMRKASIKQHREILNALRDNDSEKASLLMKEHWIYAMEKSLEKIEK